MIDDAATFDSADKGSRVAQIALDGLDAVELAEFGGVAGEGADGVAAIEELAGDVPSDESGGAGDQRRLHFWPRMNTNSHESNMPDCP